MLNDKPSDTARLRARRLRRSTTDAEKLLWKSLRKLDVQGSHFRRQIPIGPYIADFGCMAARLLIEVDGSQHAEAENKTHDDVRTRWLEREGYRVLRFWNNDITKSMQGVMETIYAAIHGSPSAEPMPLRHERRRRKPSHLPTRRASRDNPPPAGEGER
ncbi:MAG TPA: endonuclease domain-containing protein [Xanthobacteraceae bacterium]|jgi:very-short-patch-repair endonuclease|nr:endonuclease domain-containing protein [Xanthobacteraceae bacterium]